MKKFHQVASSRSFALFVALLASAALQTAGSVTHVVKFGGTFGFAYSPADFTCAVGDTVVWEGSFSSHPLSSTSVPAGAPAFHHASGSSFAYPVTAAGTYHNKCDFHSGSGMLGQFTAEAATGIGDRGAGASPEAFGLEPNYPNPFNPSTTLRYSIPETGPATLKIYDVLGNDIATLAEGIQPAGRHEVRFDGSGRPAGVYVARLEAPRFTAVRRLVLTK